MLSAPRFRTSPASNPVHLARSAPLVCRASPARSAPLVCSAPLARLAPLAVPRPPRQPAAPACPVPLPACLSHPFATPIPLTCFVCTDLPFDSTLDLVSPRIFKRPQASGAALASPQPSTVRNPEVLDSLPSQRSSAPLKALKSHCQPLTQRDGEISLPDSLPQLIATAQPAARPTMRKKRRVSANA